MGKAWITIIFVFCLRKYLVSWFLIFILSTWALHFSISDFLEWVLCFNLQSYHHLCFIAILNSEFVCLKCNCTYNFETPIRHRTIIACVHNCSVCYRHFSHGLFAFPLAFIGRLCSVITAPPGHLRYHFKHCVSLSLQKIRQYCTQFIARFMNSIRKYITYFNLVSWPKQYESLKCMWDWSRILRLALFRYLSQQNRHP